MLSKKLLSLGLIGVLSASLMVGCSDDKKDKTESSNTKQEQKTFKEETITDNEYIKMTLIGKEKNEYGAITLKVLIENKTDKALGVYEENFEVNGIMNEPCWCCNVNGKSKAYSFIEWYPDNELNSNVKSVDDLKNIKGDIYITDSNYNEIFRTQVSILCETESTKENKTVNTEQVQKETTVSISDEKQEQALDKPDSTPKEDNNKSTQKKSNENTTKEDKKEEPKYDEYGYDQYGNYNPNKDLYNDREWDDEDHERWEDIHDDEEDYEDYSEQEASDFYWCDECQCFSTYQHNHPIEEADDAE